MLEIFGHIRFISLTLAIQWSLKLYTILKMKIQRRKKGQMNELNDQFNERFNPFNFVIDSAWPDDINIYFNVCHSRNTQREREGVRGAEKKTEKAIMAHWSVGPFAHTEEILWNGSTRACVSAQVDRFCNTHQIVVIFSFDKLRIQYETPTTIFCFLVWAILKADRKKWQRRWRRRRR